MNSRMVISKRGVARRSPASASLRSPLFRQRIVKSKKIYSRKRKVNYDC